MKCYSYNLSLNLLTNQGADHLMFFDILIFKFVGYIDAFIVTGVICF